MMHPRARLGGSIGGGSLDNPILAYRAQQQGAPQQKPPTASIPSLAPPASPSPTKSNQSSYNSSVFKHLETVVNVQIVDIVAEVSILQRYNNTLPSTTVNAVGYLFPLPLGVGVLYDVEVMVDEETVVSFDKDKDALLSMINRNGRIISGPEHETKAHRIDIGTVLGGKEVAVKCTYITELKVIDGGKIAFVLPPNIIPLHGLVSFAPPSDLPPSPSPSLPDLDDDDMSISISFVMSSPILELTSPSHPNTASSHIRGNKADVEFTVAMSNILGREFVVTVRMQDPTTPRLWQSPPFSLPSSSSSSPSQEMCAEVAVLFPHLIPSVSSPVLLASSSPSAPDSAWAGASSEILFVVDVHSAPAVLADVIASLAAGLQHYLSAVPAQHHYFNIMGFNGSSFSSCFKQATVSSATVVAEATTFVQGLVTYPVRTSLFVNELEPILATPPTNGPRQVVVFTNADVSEIEALAKLSLVKETRLFVATYREDSTPPFALSQLVRARGGDIIQTATAPRSAASSPLSPTSSLPPRNTRTMLDMVFRSCLDTTQLSLADHAHASLNIPPLFHYTLCTAYTLRPYVSSAALSKTGAVTTRDGASLPTPVRQSSKTFAIVSRLAALRCMWQIEASINDSQGSSLSFHSQDAQEIFDRYVYGLPRAAAEEEDAPDAPMLTSTPSTHAATVTITATTTLQTDSTLSSTPAATTPSSPSLLSRSTRTYAKSSPEGISRGLQLRVPLSSSSSPENTTQAVLPPMLASLLGNIPDEAPGQAPDALAPYLSNGKAPMDVDSSMSSPKTPIPPRSLRPAMPTLQRLGDTGGLQPRPHSLAASAPHPLAATAPTPEPVAQAPAAAAAPAADNPILAWRQSRSVAGGGGGSSAGSANFSTSLGSQEGEENPIMAFRSKHNLSATMDSSKHLRAPPGKRPVSLDGGEAPADSTKPQLTLRQERLSKLKSLNQMWALSPVDYADRAFISGEELEPTALDLALESMKRSVNDGWGCSWEVGEALARSQTAWLRQLIMEQVVRNTTCVEKLFVQTENAVPAPDPASPVTLAPAFMPPSQQQAPLSPLTKQVDVKKLKEVIEMVLVEHRNSAPTQANPSPAPAPAVDAAAAAAVPPLHVYVTAEKGLRPYMEDRYLVLDLAPDMLGMTGPDLPNMAFFGVFDGHSGKMAADFTRTNLPYNIFRQPSMSVSEDLNCCITRGYLDTDAHVVAIAERDGRKAGTTAVSVMLDRNARKMIIANVGDSEIILSSNRTASKLTTLHTPNNEDEKERVIKAGGSVIHYGTWRVNGMLAVTRSIGDRLMKAQVCAEPSIRIHDITQADEFIILATDGLWDVLSPQEAVDFVHKFGTVTVPGQPDVSRQLVDEALRKGSRDNVTAMVVVLKEVAPDPAAPPTSIEVAPST
eukprot:TRINITY_DN4363_c0_g1_i12.p1 TRINITY_DN4363_c0_g1~~TRINITY_DN4363_c0_g1_i12.p1  ORF type:complete len:1397 (+),score=354.77 TRINITY_DN4363_c0_g1_i12:252-4442(+)